jgi:hypothetical protein
VEHDRLRLVIPVVREGDHIRSRLPGSVRQVQVAIPASRIFPAHARVSIPAVSLHPAGHKRQPKCLRQVARPRLLGSRIRPPAMVNMDKDWLGTAQGPHLTQDRRQRE